MGGDAEMKKANGLVAAFSAAVVVLTAGSAFAEAKNPDAVKIDDLKVNESLTGKAGDAEAGKKWFSNRKLGNCLACHVNKDMAALPFHGEVGTPLDGVADRYSVAEMRAILVNSKAIFGPETIMPGFYVLKTGARTQEKFQGKTILNGQQIEDIIAYLLTLKE